MVRSPYIQFQSVTKSFQSGKYAPPLVAVEAFSLQIEQGECVVILGPSGCGKSTILNMLAGFDTPTDGSVLCEGKPVTAPGHERGVVFQEDTLFPWLTVRENILFGPRCRHLAHLPDVSEVLELIGLQGFEEALPGELSGGMKQRVALARVLVNEPRVLLMDEPFGALDAQTREEMQEVLATVHARTKSTIIFVTHDIEEAVFLADRVLVMSARPGRLAADISIPLNRPRSQSSRDSEAFVRYRSELRHMFKTC